MAWRQVSVVHGAMCEHLTISRHHLALFGSPRNGLAVMHNQHPPFGVVTCSSDIQQRAIHETVVQDVPIHTGEYQFGSEAVEEWILRF
jgi:hypothetical protein